MTDDASFDRVHGKVVAWLRREHGTYPPGPYTRDEQGYAGSDRLAERILAAGVLSERDVHAIVKDEISMLVHTLLGYRSFRSPRTRPTNGESAVAPD